LHRASDLFILWKSSSS